MQIKRLLHPDDTFDLELPHDKAFDVVGFGLNSVDHLCVVPQYPSFDSKTEILRYEKLPGGQVATTLAFLSRMGLKTKYVGTTGGDDLGQFSLQSIQAENINASSVLVMPNARNNYAFIIVDQKSGERTVLWQRDSQLVFPLSALREDDVCAGRILHLDGYDYAAALQAASWGRERGIPVSLDLDSVIPQCEDLIEKVDFLIVSANFPKDLTGISDPVESLLAMRNYCSGFVAVTLGSKGAMTAVGGRCVVFPGISVQAVDTTGAGDIFHGGFIYGLLQNWPLERIMAYANAAAGLSCCYLGARSGIRPHSEILQTAFNIFM